MIDALGNVSPSTLEDVASISTTDSGQLAIDAELPSTLISVPVDPAAGIVAQSPHSDVSFTIGLPFSGEASSAEVEAEGIVSYDNQNGSVTVPVVKADGSVQINTIISNSAAPTRFDYPLSLPEGATIEEDGSGGFVISDATQVIAVIAAPWAKDANGADVATRYELSGTTLTQVVDHSVGGVAYPVVADPKATALWWGIAIKLTKAESKSLANQVNASYNAAAGTICIWVPNNLAKAACVIAVTIRLATWQAPIRQAAAEGRCVQINYPYGSGPVLWNVTKVSC
ncbi:hypothetical protein E3O42_10115 [Cryobacterium adonitolivorans]|uniref:Uncharacterized protein n=1 Tax=Cryobacterium adonitolivorans TaxID=1259189 RepID=A0A4R8W6C2_9MICO|nr:hypothetical protein [Cryobacterium adonitolivorans]TFC01465.1 hypothetical protein E3O42_10115 [Cryobacterium adonitolivorans]